MQHMIIKMKLENIESESQEHDVLLLENKICIHVKTKC